jgi:hypothetical protein
MTSTLSPTAPTQRRAAGRSPGLPARQRAADRSARAHAARQPLARYTDAAGRTREVIARGGAAGSVLVFDRDASTHGDPRLVAHLAWDEPAGNAALVCRRYLEDLHGRRGERYRCRPLTAEDALSAPFAERASEPPAASGRLAPQAERPAGTTQALERGGLHYRLTLRRTDMSIPELRWSRQPTTASEADPEPVSVRETIASLESYEPVCELTLRALTAHSRTSHASTAVLRAELARVQESPIVLNRLLRETVLARVERDGLTMSEIALRCGRIKRDRKGNESGETSWLARRIGLLPEGGQRTPTPWIHSDVLALIARTGLGVSPREVEL